MAPNKTPIRKRGQHTRARLVQAAERVFEQDGFLNARVADIASTAGVAHGSFYTYFNSKEDVFREVVDGVVNAVYASLDSAEEGSTADRIRTENRRYIELYERHAAMLGLIEQVGTLAEFHELRREMRGRFVARVETAIRQLKHDGATAGEPLDPHVVANALVGMLDNFGYTWFVLKEPFDKDVALANLDAIWIRTLGLAAEPTPPAAPAAPPARRAPAKRGRAADKPATRSSAAKPKRKP